MGKPKNRNKTGYKPIECQSIAESSNIIQEQPMSFVINPYKIIGSCKKSKSGQSLSCLIEINGKAHYLTILKKHIDSLWDETMYIAHIREYDNNNTGV